MQLPSSSCGSMFSVAEGVKIGFISLGALDSAQISMLMLLSQTGGSVAGHESLGSGSNKASSDSTCGRVVAVSSSEALYSMPGALGETSGTGEASGE